MENIAYNYSKLMVLMQIDIAFLEKHRVMES
jgi:hypothetical protein